MGVPRIHQSQLANDSAVVLYRRTQKAGITVPWAQYSGQAYSQAANGAPLALQFGADTQLLSDNAPSVPGSFSFSAQVTCYNQSANTVTPVLTVVFINSGFFTCAGGKSSQPTSPISEADVLATANATAAYSSHELTRKLRAAGLGST